MSNGKGNNDNNGINIMEIIMGALVQAANDLKAQGVEGLPDVVVVQVIVFQQIKLQ